MSNERFSAARDKMSEALNNLEKAITDKIEAIKFASTDDSKAIIETLNNEINSLQKQLAEVGLENEFLRKSEENLNNKITILKNKGKETLRVIKLDLEKIKEITNTTNQEE